MIGGTLDRYLWRHGLATIVIILILVTLVVIGIDLLLSLNMLFQGTLPPGTSRLWLIAEYVLHQIPAVVTPLLPVVLVIACLVTTAPMLRRGEFTALAASGVSLRRAVRALVVLAACTGVVDVLVSDQLVPHLESRRAALEHQLKGSHRSSVGWVVDTTGTAWYVRHANLSDAHAPVLHDVVAATAAGELVHADILRWDGGAWRLQPPVARARPGTPQLAFVDESACRGDLAIPLTPPELVRILTSRHAMTTWQLLARGGRLNRSLAYQRLVRGLAPLLAALLALPCFVRFANRDHLIVSAVRALLIGLLPVGILAIGGWAADAGSASPEAILATAAVLAAVPAVPVFARWHM